MSQPRKRQSKPPRRKQMFRWIWSNKKSRQPVFTLERFRGKARVAKMELPNYGLIFAADSGWRTFEADEDICENGVPVWRKVTRYKRRLGTNEVRLILEEYYDRRGRLDRRFEYDENGRCTRRCDYTYNRDGSYSEDCIEFLNPGEDRSAREVRTDYDKDGRPVGETVEEWDAKGNSKGQRFFDIDENGNRTEVQ